MKTILVSKKKIFYSVTGKGNTLVLLHGFMESSGIWKKFSKQLSAEFRVITIDLPGHGKSERINDVHSMELMADVIYNILKEERIRKCVMIGHSMGGYVTLAFAEKYPQLLKGFGLFHSHPFADTPEGRQNRERMIALIRKDKLGFITQFFGDLFAPATRENFKHEIEKLIHQTGKMSKEDVIAAQEGMKIRQDKTHVLRNTGIPVLLIIGMKDTRIPVDKTWEVVNLPQHAELQLFQEIAHMGFVEAPKETLSAIRGFVKRVF